jgi:hypothetical protein
VGDAFVDVSGIEMWPGQVVERGKQAVARPAAHPPADRGRAALDPAVPDRAAAGRRSDEPGHVGDIDPVTGRAHPQLGCVVERVQRAVGIGAVAHANRL